VRVVCLKGLIVSFSGDFAVLLKAGMSAKEAICYNLLSSFLCFIGMLIGISLGHSEAAAEWIYSIAAGTFLYIALVDMVKSFLESCCIQTKSIFLTDS
jgi:zinc transporter ZupT